MKSFGLISITKVINGSDGITFTLATDHINIPVDNNMNITEAIVRRIKYTCQRSGTNVSCTVVPTDVAMQNDGYSVSVDNTNKQIVFTPVMGANLSWSTRDLNFLVTTPDGTFEKVITVDTVLSPELSMGNTNLVRNSAKFSTHPTTNVRCTVTKEVSDDPTKVSGKAMSYTISEISANVGSSQVGFEIADLFSSSDYMGKRYTVSFYIKANRAMLIQNVGFDSGGMFKTNGSNGLNVTTSWVKVSNSWVYNVGGGCKFILTSNTFQNGDVISISDFKVESGFFAGDWSPHPLDVEDDLNELYSTTDAIQVSYRDIHAAINGDPEGLNPGLIAGLEEVRDKGQAIDRYIREYFEENGVIDQIKENVSSIIGDQSGLKSEVTQLTAKYNDSNKSLLEIFEKASAVAQTASEWIASFEENGTSIGSISFNPHTGLTVMTDSETDESSKMYRTVISSNQFVCQMWDPNTQTYSKDVFSLSEDKFITRRLSVSNGIDLGILKFVNTQDNGVAGIDVVLGEGIDE